MIDSMSPRAWTCVCGCVVRLWWAAAANRRLQKRPAWVAGRVLTAARRSPCSLSSVVSIFQSISTLPASLRRSVLAAQDITGTWNQSSTRYRVRARLGFGPPPARLGSPRAVRRSRRRPLGRPRTSSRRPGRGGRPRGRRCLRARACRGAARPCAAGRFRRRPRGRAPYGLAGPPGGRCERPVLRVADQGDRAARRVVGRHGEPRERQPAHAQDRDVVSGVNGDRDRRVCPGHRRLHRDVVFARDHMGVGHDDPAPHHPARPLDPQAAGGALDTHDARPGSARSPGSAGGRDRAGRVHDPRSTGRRAAGRSAPARRGRCSPARREGARAGSSSPGRFGAGEAGLLERHDRHEPRDCETEHQTRGNASGGVCRRQRAVEHALADGVGQAPAPPARSTRRRAPR